MGFQPDPDRILWRIHLTSAPATVFDLIDSDQGRASFWAESAAEQDGEVHFEFINGISYRGTILGRTRPQWWAIDYFGSRVEFSLEPDGAGGTDLTLVNYDVAVTDRAEVSAGWLNVLLPLKARADFGVDIHNHDPARTWDEAYADH